MSLQVEKLEKNMAKLTIEVSAEELEKAIEGAYQKNKNKISIPGFRKGKAPRKMIEQMYGKSVFYEDAANALIPDAYDKALEECEEQIVSSPKIDVTQLEAGKPFIFTAEVALKPEVTLGKYKGVKVDKIDVKVSDEDIDEFIGIINRIAQEHPILVDKYIMGKEIEVDAICDGTDILIPGIMEHIERTGIHSGDSISVYPAKSITEDNKKTIVEYTEKLARALHVKGMINIQFIVNDEGVFIIEVNPRSSRTVPYISKVTGIPIVPLATQIICGHTIRELGYTPGLQKEADYYAVKMPVFSFEKIRGADISLGPEMKSTGECLGIAKTFNEALYKAFQGAGIKLPKYKNMVMTVRDSDKEEMLDIAARFKAQGYRIFCTAGTAKYFNEHGVKVIPVRKIEQESPNLLDLILGHEIDLVIDIPAQGAERSHDGFIIRRNAIETGVTVLTAVDTARALVTSMENRAKELTLINIAEI